MNESSDIKNQKALILTFKLTKRCAYACAHMCVYSMYSYAIIITYIVSKNVKKIVILQ